MAAEIKYNMLQLNEKTLYLSFPHNIENILEFVNICSCTFGLVFRQNSVPGSKLSSNHFKQLHTHSTG